MATPLIGYWPAALTVTGLHTFAVSAIAGATIAWTHRVYCVSMVLACATAALAFQLWYSLRFLAAEWSRPEAPRLFALYLVFTLVAESGILVGGFSMRRRNAAPC
jgi:hypothetical protein